MNTFSSTATLATTRSSTPLYRHTISAGRYSVEVIAYGRPRNWSLSLLNQPDSEKAEELRSQLTAIFSQLKLQTVYALSPDFSRKQVNRIAFGACEWIGDTAFHRNSCAGGDAFGIEPGEAIIITPANCATVVGVNPSGMCWIAHAGTNCLFNAEGLREAVRTGSPIEAVPHESVMGVLLDELGFYARMGIFGAMPPKLYPFRLTDKQYGPLNEALLLYLQKHGWSSALPYDPELQSHCFNPAELIRLQCGTRGMTIVDEDVIMADPKSMFLDPRLLERNLIIVRALPGTYEV